MRILLAIFVLALVAGVSLFQAYRQKDKVDSAFQQGMIAGTTNEVALRSQVDSLQITLGAQQVAFSDSLTKKEVLRAEQIDSLSKELTARDSVIALQKKKAKTLVTTKQTEPNVAAKPVDPQHQQILTYYRQRCESLPKDLTDYERKVAFAEIRSETAQKFTITITELNHIRSEYKLGY